MENLKEKTEICVLCDKETPYKFTDNIDLRNWYVEGAGQLCENCYNDLYERKKK